MFSVSSRTDPRVFSSQTLLPGLPVSSVAEIKTSSTAESAERVYAHQMVRTDCRAQKLDAFLKPKDKKPADPEAAGTSGGRTETRTGQSDCVEMEDADMLEAVCVQEAEGPKDMEEPDVPSQDVQR